MKKFKDGFSLQIAVCSLAIVIAISIVLPIYIQESYEKKIQKANIEESSDVIFQDFMLSYAYANAAHAGFFGDIGKGWTNGWNDDTPWNAAGCAASCAFGGSCCEPIIFDLTGKNNIIVSDIANGIHFDYDGDGFAEKTSWAKDEDGILVVDLNNNGKIDNEKELIHHEHLKIYDTNQDGIIDSKDKDFKLLRIMKRNGGITTLEDEDIVSINLDIKSVDYTDEVGNYKFGEGTFTKNNGKVYRFDEYYFVSDFSNNKELDMLEETPSVSKLPDIKSRGKVRSLHQAMIRDKELQNLVEKFVKEQNENKRQELVSKIILKWTDCEKIAEDAMGEYVNTQHLAVVEAFMGYSLERKKLSHVVIPKDLKLGIIDTIYKKLENYVYAELSSQTNCADLMKLVKFKNQKCDFSSVVKQLDKELKFNPALGKERILQFAKIVKGLGLDKNSNFFDINDKKSFYLFFTKNDRELKWGIDTISKIPLKTDGSRIIDGEIKGTAEDDSYRIRKENAGLIMHMGYGDDVVYGDAEDDTFVGCSGADIFDGGDGNDTLEGSEGDDMLWGGRGDDQYFFRILTGNDIIYDTQGYDSIYFAKDVNSDRAVRFEDLTFEKSGKNMVIKIKNVDNEIDQIIVLDWFVNEKLGIEHKIEVFEFEADGSKHFANEIKLSNK